MMNIKFEWDPRKAKINNKKHGVSFEEAEKVFRDPFSITIADPLHSFYGEDRYIIIGRSDNSRIIVVVHCDRINSIRIISARKASNQERGKYEENR